MNIKITNCQKVPILLAYLWIALILCDCGYAWQPEVFYGYDKDTLWGTETNCVKAGLLLQYAPDTNRTLVGFFPVLNNSCATNCPVGENNLWLWLPPFHSRYRMNLTDAKGMAVPKTEKGGAFGKAIDLPLRVRTGINVSAGYQGKVLLLNTPNVILSDPFVLEDYFIITNAGKFHLKFEMMVVWPNASNPTNAIHLPPVDADIEIRIP
jgi:hypothetical protein